MRHHLSLCCLSLSSLFACAPQAQPSDSARSDASDDTSILEPRRDASPADAHSDGALPDPRQDAALADAGSDASTNRCTPVPGAQRLEVVRPGDERLRQRRNLENGTYFIELAPHPEWRRGPNAVPDSSYLRFEGANPADLERAVSVSRCPGDVSADDDTLQVISGEAGAFGTYLYFYGLPSSAPPAPANSPRGANGLPGLLEATTWYLNIRQTRCEHSPGNPAPTCGLTYDVIP
jgi:hypothetical protein